MCRAWASSFLFTLAPKISLGREMFPSLLPEILKTSADGPMDLFVALTGFLLVDFVALALLRPDLLAGVMARVNAWPLLFRTFVIFDTFVTFDTLIGILVILLI